MRNISQHILVKLGKCLWVFAPFLDDAMAVSMDATNEVLAYARHWGHRERREHFITSIANEYKGP